VPTPTPDPDPTSGKTLIVYYSLKSFRMAELI
jgi:hypothetical protein